MTEVSPLKRLSPENLAIVVLAAIEHNLKRWDQGSWRIDHGNDVGEYCTNPTTAIEAFVDDPFNPACTTSFCYAGWVGAYDRVKWVKGSNEMIGDPARCDCTGHCCENFEHQMPVGSYARSRLGLAYHEAEALFNGDIDLEQLRAGVAAIVAGTDVSDAISDAGDGETSWVDSDESDDE